MKEHFTTTYEATEDGGVRFTAATLDGRTFSMQLEAEEALNNLRAFATVMGLHVCLSL